MWSVEGCAVAGAECGVCGAECGASQGVGGRECGECGDAACGRACAAADECDAGPDREGADTDWASTGSAGQQRSNHSSPGTLREVWE